MSETVPFPGRHREGSPERNCSKKPCTRSSASAGVCLGVEGRRKAGPVGAALVGETLPPQARGLRRGRRARASSASWRTQMGRARASGLGLVFSGESGECHGALILVVGHWSVVSRQSSVVSRQSSVGALLAEN